MLFSDLDAGDVFVLKWWLDTGPALRHYLVVRREGSVIFVLRLEHDDHKVLQVDCESFDDLIVQRDVNLVQVYKRDD